MPAAAFPFATCDPFFMEEEPFDGPWNDVVNDVLGWPPSVVDGIVDAKAREFRRMAEPINMLRRLTRTARIGTNGRIDDKDADAWIRKMPSIEVTAREINEPHPIGLADRRKCAFPDTHPSTVCNKSKLRAFSAQFPILFVDGKRKHDGLITPGATSRRGPRGAWHSGRTECRNAATAQNVKALA